MDEGVLRVWASCLKDIPVDLSSAVHHLDILKQEAQKRGQALMMREINEIIARISI